MSSTAGSTWPATTTGARRRRAMRRAEARALRLLERSGAHSPVQAGVAALPGRLDDQSSDPWPTPDSRNLALRHAPQRVLLGRHPRRALCLSRSGPSARSSTSSGGRSGRSSSASCPSGLRDRPEPRAVWDILATLIVIVLVTLLGYVSRYVFGKFFFSIGERFIQTIPGVSAVYNTVKQIVNTFSSQSRPHVQQGGAGRVPAEGVLDDRFSHQHGPGRGPGRRRARRSGRSSCRRPRTRRAASCSMLPRSEIVELDMAVGEGMKMIISGGAVVPPWPAVETPKSREAR